MTRIADPVPPEPPASSSDANEEPLRLQALARLIRRGQGRFSIAFVQFDLPRTRERVVSELRAATADLHVVRVDLAPPPADAPSMYNVLDQLRELVTASSPSRAPDALLVGGYERLLGESADGASTARAIQPLNLGRVVLASSNPYPLVFLLPQGAMALLLQTAPDLRSWQSGYFKFEADLPRVRQEIAEAARLVSPVRLRLAFRGREARLQELDRLRQLLNDADVIEKNLATLAALRYRLGWLALHSGQVALARQAFASMLELARASKDARLIRAAERGRRAASSASPDTRLRPKGTARIALQAFRGTGDTVGRLLGRAEELQRLVARLDQVDCRFLVLWGRTGSGKSWLVRAGLVPRLAELGRYLPVVIDRWHDPIPTLDQALRREALKHASLQLDAGASLAEHIRAVTRATGKTVVLVCDQFEQFFTPGRLEAASEPEWDVPSSLSSLTKPWVAEEFKPVWRRFLLDFHRGTWISTGKRPARRQELETLGNLIGDVSLACKVLLVIRDDALGDVAEFDEFLPEPLEQRKRFYLPLLSRADAERALRQIAEATAVAWSDRFVTGVVNELARDGRVRPIDIHLVGVALGLSGVDNEYDFARAGGTQGLIDDYLDLLLASLYEPGLIAATTRVGSFGQRVWSDAHRVLARTGFEPWYIDLLARLFQRYERRTWLNVCKQVLLALIDEPPRRMALDLSELERKTGQRPLLLITVLRRTIEAGIVRGIEGQQRSVSLFVLEHDELVSLVLRSAQKVHSRRREADRMLKRALEDALATKWRALGLRSWFRVRAHASEELQGTPAARSLLNRSLALGIANAIVIALLAVGIAGGIAAAIQLTRGHLTLEFGAEDRLVVRRGIPALGFLPFIGDGIVLDTGVVREDIRADALVPLLQLRHQQFGDHQSGVLTRPELLSSLRGDQPLAIRVALASESERPDVIDELLGATGRFAEWDTSGSLAASLIVDPVPTLAGIQRVREAVAKGPLQRQHDVLTAATRGIRAYLALEGLREDVSATESLLVDALERGVPDAQATVIEFARTHPERANALTDRLLATLSTSPAFGDEENRAAIAAALVLSAPDDSPRAGEVSAAATEHLLRGVRETSSTRAREANASALEKLARRDRQHAAALGSRLARVAAGGEPALSRDQQENVLSVLSRVAPLYTGGVAALERALETALVQPRSGSGTWLPDVARRLDAGAADRLVTLVSAPMDSPDPAVRLRSAPRVLTIADIAIGQPSLAPRVAAMLAEMLEPKAHGPNGVELQSGPPTRTELEQVAADERVAQAAAASLAGLLRARPDLAAGLVEPTHRALEAETVSKGPEPRAVAASDDDVWLRLASVVAAGAGAAASSLVEPVVAMIARAVETIDTTTSPPLEAVTALVRAVPGACLVVQREFEPLLSAADQERRVAVALLDSAAAADPSCADRLLPTLLSHLAREVSPSHRGQIAGAFAGAARMRPESVVNAPAFLSLLNDSELNVQLAAWEGVSAALVALVPPERPEQFLLDHLDGTRTLLAAIGADSHTRAAYRYAVSRAIAEWLSKGEIATDAHRRALWFLLVTYARTHPELHVRLTAFEALGFTATRIEQRQREQGREGAGGG